MKTWETKTMCFKFIEENGILIGRSNSSFKGSENVGQAQENLESMESNTGGAMKAAVIHVPEHYIPVAVTNIYKKSPFNVPIALVADTFFKRMQAKFLLALQRDSKPMRVFKDKEAALSWVSSILV